MTNILNIHNLSKSYGAVRALQNLNLAVPNGSVYGLLGPNGSGKTTTLGLVLDVLRPDSGSYEWFGETTSFRTKRRIGAILETPNFYPYLTALQNLEISAQVKGVPFTDISRVLDLAGLENRKKSKFKGFSLGMKQRLAMASAMLGNPEVLVLDEPTNGLDPQGIVEVRELISKISDEGKTIIIASHLLDEVEKICTHVAVLQNGILKANGPVQSILSTEDTLHMQAEDMQTLQQAFNNLFPDLRASIIKDDLVVNLSPGITSAEINRRLISQGIVLSKLLHKKKSLESQFLEITRK